MTPVHHSSMEPSRPECGCPRGSAVRSFFSCWVSHAGASKPPIMPKALLCSDPRSLETTGVLTTPPGLTWAHCTRLSTQLGQDPGAGWAAVGLSGRQAPQAVGDAHSKLQTCVSAFPHVSLMVCCSPSNSSACFTLSLSWSLALTLISLLPPPSALS